MPQLRLSIHTQTPLVRFLRDGPEGALLASFRDGEDYVASPGGVTRMVQALLRRLVDRGRVREATWMSLARGGPEDVALTDRVLLRHVQLPSGTLETYAQAKARVWNAVHGLGSADLAMFPAGFGALARAMSRRALEAHARRPYDVFYVHDFQLLPLGPLLPRGVPRLFRWHIPVPEGPLPILPEVARAMNEYDGVVVSTAAYARRLRRAGVDVPLHVRYPYLDEAHGSVVTADDVARFERAHGLDAEDVVFLVVARMDPMKSHDVAIRALAEILPDAPRARLVLVGGGGFSAGEKGSLGLDFAARWRAHLVALADELGVGHRVTFAGSVPDADLHVAYTRARAVLLPSRLEGFGLAAIEGWLFGRPVVVSQGAGVAELVADDRNGFTHAPGDVPSLAEAMRTLAADEEAAARMGEAGRRAARVCHLEQGAAGIGDLLERLALGARTGVP